MTLVADTGGLYALYDADDAHHSQAPRVIQRKQRLIIAPVVILTELDYLLRTFLGVAAELDFLDGVLSGAFILEPLTLEDVKRCYELLATYRDLDRIKF